MRLIHNPHMENVGQRIKKLRLARKLTQQQLAKAIGIKQGSLTQLETGLSKSPSSSTLTKLARLFEVDPEWLMTGKGVQTHASLTEVEAELVLLFRNLSQEGQGYILGRARSVSDDEQTHRTPRRRSSDLEQDKPDGPH